MAVLRIEKYGDVLKVILKPTKAFPNGYFYTDNNPVVRELVESYSWCLYRKDNLARVETSFRELNTGQKTLRFPQAYAYQLLGYSPDCLDHINGLEIDNRDDNLNIITRQQNARNKPSIGYYFVRSYCFRPRCRINDRLYYRGSYKTEPEALIATYFLRKEVFQDYDYNFYLDRRDDLDILDAELTRKITTQQAIYFHVKRYVEANPWYAYRYNLFDYCNHYNIIIPSFCLDNQGFMIDSTGKKLCPY